MNFKRFTCFFIYFLCSTHLVFSITYQDRLSGVLVKQDGPEFDEFNVLNGYNNCVMETNGELNVMRMIRPKDILTDVGANQGDWTSYALGQMPNIRNTSIES